MGEEEQNCGYNITDFETGLNNWNETSNGLYKWIRDYNEIPNGPATDLTTGLTSGYYIYVASYSGTSNTNSRFSSPVLRDSWSTCRVTFWYQINGNSIGAIEVYLNVGSQRSRIARITTETNNQWVQATINLGRYRSAFSLDIEAFRSFKITGNIAVDDIEFKNCAMPKPTRNCYYYETQCANKLCVSNSRLCDFSDDCGDLTDEKNTTCSNYLFRCNFKAVSANGVKVMKTYTTGDAYQHIIRLIQTSYHKETTQQAHQLVHIFI